MNGRIFCTAFILLIYSGSTAAAQVVQLPTFHQFGVSTTVMVPDRGSTTVADIYRAREAEAMAGLGPLRNRGFGREMGRSTVGMSTRIMDLREMDEEVLRMAGSDRDAGELASLERADRLTRGVARTTGRGPTSVAELRRQRAAKESAEREQVLHYIQQAEDFREQGKLTTAKALYRMAWHRTSDEQLRRDLKDRLAQLEDR